MKIKQEAPKREYPYLAVMTFGEPVVEGKVYPVDEIYLISKISRNNEEDTSLYAINIGGGREGWFVKKEADYAPLPKGYKIEITQ